MCVCEIEQRILFLFQGSVDEMEKGEENLTDDNNMSERETVASNHDESADCDTSSSFYSEGNMMLQLSILILVFASWVLKS